jgi:hypothetical protein
VPFRTLGTGRRGVLPRRGQSRTTSVARFGHTVTIVRNDDTANPTVLGGRIALGRYAKLARFGHRAGNHEVVVIFNADTRSNATILVDQRQQTGALRS